MMLQPICIEAEARVCMKAAVAPGATVGPGKVVGPLSSTHEASNDGAEGACFAASCRPLLPAPAVHTQLLLGWPLIIACKVRLHLSWTCLRKHLAPAALCQCCMGLLQTCSQGVNGKARNEGMACQKSDANHCLPWLNSHLRYNFSIAVQVFASIPPLLVLAGLLITLHGELGGVTMSETLRCVKNADMLVTP